MTYRKYNKRTAQYGMCWTRYFAFVTKPLGQTTIDLQHMGARVEVNGRGLGVAAVGPQVNCQIMPT